MPAQLLSRPLVRSSLVVLLLLLLAAAWRFGPHASRWASSGWMGSGWMGADWTGVAWAEDDLGGAREAPAKECGALSCDAICESSGLAPCLNREGAFWTHNDSGDSARLFLLDERGGLLAEHAVSGAAAVDWEDIASFASPGRNWLLIGDVGDNASRRRNCTLYLIAEPSVEEQQAGRALEVAARIPFTYEDGPRDCESLAVDAQGETIYLASKSWTGDCRLYTLPLVASSPSKPQVARCAAQLEIPLATAMDLSADGRQAVIISYALAYRFTRAADEPWTKAWGRRPQKFVLPQRKQGEAACFDAAGKRLYLTSEGFSQPFWEVELPGESPVDPPSE